MKKRSDNRQLDPAIARLMGLGERSVQKSYYPQLRKKIRELEKSQRKYRLLAENISDVIWRLDLDLCISYISPSIEPMGGFSPKELKGKPFASLLEPDYSEIFTRRLKNEIKEQACQGPGPHREMDMELCQQHKNGDMFWIEVKISCTQGEGENGNHILGVSRDITARKQAEHEKEEVQKQLLQSQKMESIGTLAGGIAHDFNNLLTIINGYSDLILKKTEPDHPLFKKITAISHAGKRAEKLTRQLLAFSRKQVFSPSPIDINTILPSMDTILRRLIGEDIHVQTLLDRQACTILADQNQIEQIFTNLVINARDALARKGDALDPDKPTSQNKSTGPDFKKQITIETGQTLFDGELAKKTGLTQPGNYIYFSVSDNGIGMDKGVQEKIFEPFFTTKPKEKGTGLGLAMIYGIVKQNRGSIQVYSEPDHGSMFKIHWPATTRKIEKEKPKGRVVETLSGEETILLVEDDKDVLNFAANALISLGYDIHRVGNGREGLTWIKNRSMAEARPADMIITDLVMPELNGIAFIRQARKIMPEIRVIYVSGYTDNHIVKEGLLEDGVNFLQKPYSQIEIARMIRKVMDQDPCK